MYSLSGREIRDGCFEVFSFCRGLGTSKAVASDIKTTKSEITDIFILFRMFDPFKPPITHQR